MIMSSELENCLAKAISEFKVRDMLTKFGLPEDAEVTLEMQLSENSKPIASCSIPTTVKKDHIPCGSISVRSLRYSLKDDFINPAIGRFDLGTLIPETDGSVDSSENKLIVSLSSKNSDFNLDFSMGMHCCIPGCGKCCEYCF